MAERKKSKKKVINQEPVINKESKPDSVKKNKLADDDEDFIEHQKRVAELLNNIRTIKKEEQNIKNGSTKNIANKKPGK